MELFAFDFDGTLIDSMGMWRNLGKNYLERRGIEYTEEIAKEITTMSLTMSSEFFKKRFDFDESVEEIYGEMGDILMDGYTNHLQLKDHALDILQEVEARGYPMILATATNEAFVRPALARFGIDKYFQWIHTCDNSGYQKGDVRYYHMISQRLTVPADKIVFFDDAPYALEAAKEAGLYTVGVRDTYNQAVWTQVVENSSQTIDSFKDFTFK